jgi:small subunit ribosomal protein S3
MGQKVNPVVFRLPITRGWAAAWYKSKTQYAKAVIEDLRIQNYFKSLPKDFHIRSVKIDRMAEKILITVFTAKAKAVGEALQKDEKKIFSGLEKVLGYKLSKDMINIADIKNPNFSAAVVGMMIAMQVEKRVSYIKAIKRAVEQTMKAGALGIKVKISGRLSGAEIARSEKYGEGKLPLQEMRANIDYALIKANTVYGVIGIKVWINTQKK